MGFPRQEYWSGLPFPSPGDLPHPGIESSSPASQADSLPPSHQGTPETMNPSYLFTEGWDALLFIMKCCQSPGTGGHGEGKNKPHVVAVPASSLVINCILLGALPALRVSMCQTHFPLLSTCQGCVNLLVLKPPL